MCVCVWILTRKTWPIHPAMESPFGCPMSASVILLRKTKAIPLCLVAILQYIIYPGMPSRQHVVTSCRWRISMSFAKRKFLSNFPFSSDETPLVLSLRHYGVSTEAYSLLVSCGGPNFTHFHCNCLGEAWSLPCIIFSFSMGNDLFGRRVVRLLRQGR